MATTIPTAKASWFTSKLLGKGKLFPLGTGDKGVDVLHSVKVKGQDETVEKEFKVRTETLVDLLEIAEASGLTDRVKEIEEQIKHFSTRSYGSPSPEIGDTRRYSTNKAGYVQISTKILQEIEGTYLLENKPIEQGLPDDDKKKIPRRQPAKDKAGKIQKKKNGDTVYDDNWSSYVDVSYEADRIVIQVAPIAHRRKIEEAPAEAKAPAKKRGRPKKKS
jgi:hypothetical protein